MGRGDASAAAGDDSESIAISVSSSARPGNQAPDLFQMFVSAYSDCARTRVTQHMFDLIGGTGRVKWHHHSAHSQHGQVDNHPLRAVFGQDCDPVAGFEAPVSAVRSRSRRLAAAISVQDKSIQDWARFSFRKTLLPYFSAVRSKAWAMEGADVIGIRLSWKQCARGATLFSGKPGRYQAMRGTSWPTIRCT